jgi:uncharacterized protein YutE (UPF0331/DUF86 family)
MAASDILFHVLAEQGQEAGTYRGAFRLAAQEGLLPEDLANRLQQAAAMRNVLVHMYDEINYEILRDSIAPSLNDFAMFVSIFSHNLGD